MPEALAYATIAGVSPVVGLYAAPGALLLYAAFGSSRQLVVGPMAATAALSAAAVGDLAAGGSDEFLQLTITMGLVVGILALAAGLCRLGFLASFISEPVLKGFIIGLALTIIVGQLPKLFGVEKGEGNFFEQLWDFLGELDGTSGLTLLVGLAVAGARDGPEGARAGRAGVARRRRGRHPRRPALRPRPARRRHRGRHRQRAALARASRRRPSPTTSTSRPAALGVMLIGFAEGLGAAKTYAAKKHYEVDANRELLGLGAANLGSGLSSGMVVNGSLSKTAVNASAGANSQLSGLVVAALTIVTLLFLTGLFEELPEATLAAIVIAALVELVDVRSLVALYRFHARGAGRVFRRRGAARLRGRARDAAGRPPLRHAARPLHRRRRLDRAPRLPRVAAARRRARAGFPGTRSQWGDVARHPENEPVPGIVVLRPESGLWFANADMVRDAIRAQATGDVRAVVVDAETVPAVDVTAVGMLVQLAEDLRRDGIELVLARDIGAVRDLVETGGQERVLRSYPTVQAAVDELSGQS